MRWEEGGVGGGEVGGVGGHVWHHSDLSRKQEVHGWRTRWERWRTGSLWSALNWDHDCYHDHKVLKVFTPSVKYIKLYWEILTKGIHWLMVYSDWSCILTVVYTDWRYTLTNALEWLKVHTDWWCVLTDGIYWLMVYSEWRYMLISWLMVHTAQ